MTMTNTLPKIKFTADSEPNEIPMTFEFQHSEHSLSRALQRGLTETHLRLALKYGKVFRKQGMQFYVLGEKDLPDNVTKEVRRFSNTIVLVSGQSNSIITCYRNNDPYRFVKRKSKLLKPFRNAA